MNARSRIHRFSPTVSLVLGLSIFAAACSRDAATEAREAPASSAGAGTATTPGASAVEPRAAIANLAPTQGNAVRGTVRFVRESDGVRVIAEVTGLTPGDHGFHVHENGDCSAPDASSAGDHFNPTHEPHAGREAERRHVGDLGNLVATEEGRAELNYLDRKLTLSGKNSILGRAVIVHAGADDLKSQPSGNSGARIACGVISAAP